MKTKSNKWTKEEDIILIKYYRKYGSKFIRKKLNYKKTINSIYHRVLKLRITSILNRWNKSEIKILVKNHIKHIDELCILLPNKNRESILIKRCRLGLSIKNYKWDKKDKKNLKKHWAKSDKETIKKLFENVTWHTITEMARRLGLKRLTEYRKGDLSPLLKENNVAYYWIGFIMADGWISKDGQLVIAISIKDKNHINKLAKLLKTKITIINCTDTAFSGKHYKRQKIARLAIQDKKLGISLKNKMNITYRKTYNPPNLSFLNSKNKFLSFIAGFIDGDGSMSKKSCCIRIQCHKNWIYNLKFMKNKLDIIIPDNNIKVNTSNYRNGTCSLVSNKKSSLKLKQIIIKLNIPIMQRKWNRIKT